MKKLMINILMPAFIALTIMSCEKTVEDIDLPEVEKQLVVYSFLSPENDTVFVEVSHSEPFFGQDQYQNNSNFVTDADVRFTHDGTEEKLQYDNLENRYYLPVSGFKIETGKLYRIKAKAPEMDAVSSQCIVPSEAPTNLQLLETDATDNMYGEIQLKFSFTDIPNEKNYYRIILYMKDITFTGDTIWTESGQHWENMVNVFSDENRDGNTIAVRTFHYNVFSKTEIDFKVVLMSVDEHYYHFFDKLNKAYANDGNPFSEPVIPYSNIENGLGVFAAYSSYTRRFTVKLDQTNGS